MIEALTQFFLEWGYWGLFLAAFAAGSILPLGSEAVFVLLLATGLEPAGCLVAATAGNTLGGMSCYWIGRLGKTEWIAKLGIGKAKLEKAQRFLRGRGALMAFFSFLPAIGEAIAVALGLMRANLWLRQDPCAPANSSVTSYCGSPSYEPRLPSDSHPHAPAHAVR